MGEWRMASGEWERFFTIRDWPFAIRRAGEGE